MSWKAPPSLKEPYTKWKDELSIWQNFTDIEESKQGSALFLSLPPGNARDAVLELGPTAINGKDGVDKIIGKLDSLFLKDDNVATYQAWQSFIKFKRGRNMNMTDYSIEFSKLYTVCKNAKLILPTGVLALQFLESANLPQEQHRLALATCESIEYDKMKAQVLKISTDIATPDSSSILQPKDIKVECDTLHVAHSNTYEEADENCDGEVYEEEEPLELSDAMYNARYYQNYRGSPKTRTNNWYPSGGRSRGASQRGNWRSSPSQNLNSWSNQGNFGLQKLPYRGGGNSNRSKKINPSDRFGRPRQCRECFSIYHLEENCPETEGHITLITDETGPTSSFLAETIGCMVVDSGCINTVCGKSWLESYIESLSVKDRKSIATGNSNVMFRFGNGTSFRSLKKVTVPIYLGSMRARIVTDVVSCEIPLLFSKESLKRAHGSINFVHDKITLMNETIPLETTSTGHYYIRISRNTEGPVENVADILFSVNISDLDAANLHKTALKWHKQFAHPPADKLQELVTRANIDSEGLYEAIKKVLDTC